MTTCKRGEIWLVNFNPGRGSEQKGLRPALIIQNDTGNQYASTTVVAAITPTIKRYPVTVLIPRREGGLKESSTVNPVRKKAPPDLSNGVNLAQILTIDKGRLIKRLGQFGDDKMHEVDEAIKVSLGIKWAT